MNKQESFAGSVAANPAIASRFSDLQPPLDQQAAIPEANRCLFCFDAPCTAACPTHIDVPLFIRKITSGNVAGAAHTILDANILGGSCARACPVEVLCEGACVLHRYNKQPIQIGRLQRFAIDTLHASGASLPFEPGPATGRTVALIGAGPASLACAAELRRRGIGAVVYDARPLPGGLNTYGVAEYKLPLLESLREIDMLARLGVEFHSNTHVDASLLAEIVAEHDAIFLGIGLGAIQSLGITGERLRGVTDALTFIAGYKSGTIVDIPAKVVVVGAGNTAMDAAIAAVRLGALEVHVVYRQGEAQMPAFSFEYAHAKMEGVRFLWHTQPVRFIGDGSVRSLALRSTAPAAVFPSSAPPSVLETEFLMEADLVILATGQSAHAHLLAESIALERGRIVIDRATGQTSRPNYFAGGDCTNGGREVVDAVADGKRAGVGIAAWLGVQHGRA